eukprot:1886485-Pleurochrysis_carterae.AAC.1
MQPPAHAHTRTSASAPTSLAHRSHIARTGALLCARRSLVCTRACVPASTCAHAQSHACTCAQPCLCMLGTLKT